MGKHIFFSVSRLGILAVLLLALFLTSCGQDSKKSVSKQTTQEEISKIEKPEPGGLVLVAYFSLADEMPDGADAVSCATPVYGNTKTAAEEVAHQTGGTLFAITTEKKYPVSHEDCSEVAEKEQKADERPQLSSHIPDMEKYKMVYLGFPIWWYQESMAVRSFLEEYDFSDKSIFPFCTTLGADIGGSVDNIKSICPKAVVEEGITLLTESGDFSEEITEWLQ